MLAAIETSFDDAGIALAYPDGRILRSVLANQLAAHQPYAGVVPELAARTHVRDLPALWRSLEPDGTQRLSALGVTAGPGLPGSLLAGVNFAAGLAAWHGLPLYGLNHLEGHIFSPFIPAGDSRAPGIPLPHLALIVSGGHTELFLVRGLEQIELVAQTRDDAVGELLDKVSALLGHGYPGGATLERLAAGSGLLDTEARYHGPLRLPVPLRGSSELCFSYSGLKTAVVRQVRAAQAAKAAFDAADEAALLACLFSVILDSLWDRIKLALALHPVTALSVSGGVAINGLLRRRFQAECAAAGVALWLPQPRHCLDNAEMMAWLLSLKLAAGLEPRAFDIRSNWLPGDGWV